MISARLASALVDFVGTLVTDYGAEHALSALMRTAADELSVGGAGVMLADEEGELRFVAASDDTVQLIERFQVDTREGPCALAAETGVPVFATDLRAGDDRFPRFATVAADAGLGSVHSFPMTVQGERIGALNLYRRETGILSSDEKEAGAILADMASTYLFSARRADSATRMVQDIRAAMERNAPIEHAKGYVSALAGISVSDAFDLIRRHARSTNTRVLSVAERLLSGELDLTDLR